MASKSSKKANEDWMNTKWRPAMGWMYMTVCVFDFILFPILWATIQFWETSVANDAFRQWQPLTLQGAGLFHMAMGAVLGIAAYSRGKEKIAGAADNGVGDSGFGESSAGGFGAPAASRFGAPAARPAAFTPRHSAAPSVVVYTSSTGKAMPAQPEDEEL
jgi:hypothetical protein